MLGGFLAAGGANALNQYLDRDIDHVMPRTRKRPLPGGRMAPWQVLAFGVACGAASFALLWYTANLLAALMGLCGLLFYVFIYTRMLKRHSTQNIVIGGAAGAFPPLVGWAAVSGDLSLLPILLFLVIFYWTPPHFWALALMRQREYRAAGVPMLPVVVGDNETWRQIMLYSVLMALISLAPVALQLLGPVYLVCALILNGVFLWQAWEILRRNQNQTQRNQRIWRLYKFSLLYLALLFFAMGIDRLFYTVPANAVDFVIKLPW
jgi:protoheme IX farnesyltransferase